ncbi:hypothetical protein R1flu_023568 [Riccia fluitans]|uniref:Uncharacterized protein n=1 Tax=Riccia fluitans TaxID=41844 RepID=A0ABD1XVF1_9MARC
MDGHLVELLDSDVDVVSQKKKKKKKQMGSEQPSKKRPRSESDPNDGNKGNLPSTIILDSSHMLEAPVAVDEVVVETSRRKRRRLPNPRIFQTWI